MKPAKDMIEAAAPFHCLERFTSGSKPCASICDYCMKSAEAALTAALSVQWRGMESAERIAGYNAGLEAAARHCERNALSAIPVEIRGLKKTPSLPPPPATQE